MPPIKRLLIANRGEIAVRIIRACQEAGIHSIAVYSEEDQSSPHVSLADTAVCIGPATASESYLAIPRLLEAADLTRADALHPGYGFLSERAKFAEACAKAGLTFVGPSPEVIRLLGDKIAAKTRMEDAGVPVVPGYNGEDQTEERLQQELERIGTPVLIKAAAGGGGRGMRVVEESAHFLERLAEARREALAAFGDDRVLLERYIARSRHIEFQIFGDMHGHVVHLFERECSIQRRHQKIIEESPSPALSPELRTQMAAMAVRVGLAAGYVNAGTVEFLLEERSDGDPLFYFLEVNTRLQVEHPVTEMLTGRDLVRLQLEVAEGNALPFTQEQISASGHALEVRIYAEDAEHSFLPSVGTLALWREPVGPGIRIDSGVETGSVISPFYDPMLAKLIVQGETREKTLDRMVEALHRLSVLGICTNIPYLLAILQHPIFRAGKADTRFLGEQFPHWRHEPELAPEILLALAAFALGRSERNTDLTTDHDEPSGSLWRISSGWRNS